MPNLGAESSVSGVPNRLRHRVVVSAIIVALGGMSLSLLLVSTDSTVPPTVGGSARGPSVEQIATILSPGKQHSRVEDVLRKPTDVVYLRRSEFDQSMSSSELATWAREKGAASVKIIGMTELMASNPEQAALRPPLRHFWPAHMDFSERLARTRSALDWSRADIRGILEMRRSLINEILRFDVKSLSRDDVSSISVYAMDDNGLYTLKSIPADPSCVAAFEALNAALAGASFDFLSRVVRELYAEPSVSSTPR